MSLTDPRSLSTTLLSPTAPLKARSRLYLRHKSVVDCTGVTVTPTLPERSRGGGNGTRQVVVASVVSPPSL